MIICIGLKGILFFHSIYQNHQQSQQRSDTVLENQSFQKIKNKSYSPSSFVVHLIQEHNLENQNFVIFDLMMILI